MAVGPGSGHTLLKTGTRLVFEEAHHSREEVERGFVEAVEV